MSFRLRTVFYVFALLASAMATFGLFGIFLAVIILGLWSWVFYGPRLQLLEVLVVVAVFGMLVLLLLPAVQSAREASRVASCKNNLKQLILGLINYDQTRGALPPAYTVDTNGNPILSWRVAILPHIEEQSLYELIDHNLPWDAPANKSVVSKTNMYGMQCPNDPTDATTNYFAIVGPQTAWHGSKGCRLAEISDGPENTILLIEASRRTASWAEPRDLTFDEAVDLLSSPVPEGEGHEVDNGFFYKGCRGRNVAFADGGIGFVQTPLNRELAAALLTINGHENIDASALQAASRPTLDYGKCYAFGLFVFLALLPAAWVRPATFKKPVDA